MITKASQPSPQGHLDNHRQKVHSPAGQGHGQGQEWAWGQGAPGPRLQAQSSSPNCEAPPRGGWDKDRGSGSKVEDVGWEK